MRRSLILTTKEMSPVVTYDKIILCLRCKKEDVGKYLVNGIALDVIKQGDYVNVVSYECSGKTFCGFVRRIYYGDLANSEIPLCLPGEKHTFLILLEDRYVKVNREARIVFRLLRENDEKNKQTVWGIITEYIGKVRETMKKQNLSMQGKISEIKKHTSDVLSAIRNLKIPASLKNKLVEKVKKLSSFFINNTGNNSNQNPQTPTKT